MFSSKATQNRGLFSGLRLPLSFASALSLAFMAMIAAANATDNSQNSSQSRSPRAPVMRQAQIGQVPGDRGPAQLGFPTQGTMTFSGDWTINANTNSTITLTLIQDGDNVTGQYVSLNGDKGRIVGRVQGPTMVFNWFQDSGFKGAGRLDLSSDGASFRGQYRADPHPSIPAQFLQGEWNGARISSGQSPMGQAPMGQAPMGQAPMGQPPVQPSTLDASSCEQLWFSRNSIFKRAGYCFRTQRAIRQFGNAGCQYDDENAVPLSEQDRNSLAKIRETERFRQCPR